MDYFYATARNYNQVRGKEILPSLFRIVSSLAKRDESILDVATGAGLFSIPLAEKGYRVIGIDRNPAMLGEAMQLAKERRVPFQGIQASAEQIPLGRNSLSMMLSTNAIHHFRIRRHLSEARRLLRKGGHYVIYTRFREQNARSIWGQLFPQFANKETRLYNPEDFVQLDSEFPRLTLVEMKELKFVKPFSRERLLETASARKYSTFAFYEETEFRQALKVFRKRLEEWRDEHYIAEIGRIVFRAI